ncbi:hypothetical protein [Halobacteriovorax sp. JY17]|uniref:hypothetical protein n=1 Tax=Halobacteriovorax sp. JY17 TaxID=2014617 RepID=UPI000C5DE6B7|nr:hypothetical protein [Halobacteriovorax sp. JY17]PIK15141.1 MAG: hypothetical protein CES88_00080 [Halobacteriovorax sp. JY17]
MKNLVCLFSILLASSAYAGLTPKRQALYRCVSLDENSGVDDAFIYRSNLGSRNTFHEIKVNSLENGQIKHYYKKVNLLSRYEGRVQEFTTGNFRIRVDKVRSAIDGNFWAFARIPSHEVHSTNWSCKDLN